MEVWQGTLWSNQQGIGSEHRDKTMKLKQETDTKHTLTGHGHLLFSLILFTVAFHERNLQI